MSSSLFQKPFRTLGPVQQVACFEPGKYIQKLTNNVILLLDESGSIQERRLTADVIRVVDEQVQHLKTLSFREDQETRISIYTINSTVTCIAFNMDVARMKSIKDIYKPSGMTPLRDSIGFAINDHLELPTRYGDHAFLLYAITDGLENASKIFSVDQIKNKISGLGDNWAVACVVPDQQAKSLAINCGFPSASIAIWDADAAGAADTMGTQMSTATQNFMGMRSAGVKVKSAKGLFTLDPSGITKKAVQQTLTPLRQGVDYELIHVRKGNKYKEIRDFVNSWMGANFYTPGCAYYQPTAPVVIQGNKHVLIRDKRSGKVYQGDAARQMIGLPNYAVKADPADHPDFDILIQSTSNNRKPIEDTIMVVMK